MMTLLRKLKGHVDGWKDRVLPKFAFIDGALDQACRIQTDIFCQAVVEFHLVLLNHSLLLRKYFLCLFGDASGPVVPRLLRR